MTGMTRVAKLAGWLLAVGGAAAAGVVVGGQTKEPEYPKMVVANKAEEPVPVAATVMNAPIVHLAMGAVVELGQESIAALKDGALVRLQAPEWEYSELRAPTASGSYRSLLKDLTAAGAQGWETAGLMFSDADATVVILKRQRPPA
jgi:hypothetical protein